MADRRASDWGWMEAAGLLVDRQAGPDTAGAAADFFLPPLPPSGPGGGFAHQPDPNARCKGGSSSLSLRRWKAERRGKLLFVLLEEDRWYCVSLSPRKCSLMLAKAAFMAWGYKRDGDSRQQVLAAMGKI